MNTIILGALDGANPLHVLAALGALRLVSLEDAEATLAWQDGRPHSPVLRSVLTEGQCHRVIALHLGVRGLLALQARRDRLALEIQTVDARRRTCTKDKPGRESAVRLKSELARRKAAMGRLEAVLRHADRVVASHHAFAASADCIHRVPQSVFRESAASVRSLLWNALLPGIAADCARVYGKDEIGLSRTRFSFSNGGSGKALLKDWLSNLGRLRRAEPERGGLLGFALDLVPVTGLMWEPKEQRDYALRWLDPNHDTTHSLPVLNSLAFVGLSFFPVVPRASEDRTVGFGEDERALAWPLWTPPLTATEVCSLVAASFVRNADERQVRSRGVFARYLARIVTANKRNFFAPPRPV